VLKRRSPIALAVFLVLGTGGAALSATAAAASPHPSQAPVPEGTVPQPSPSQPYVYRWFNDHIAILAEIHQPFPRDETTNPPHTQQMGLIIGTQRAALIDTGLGLADLRKFVAQFTDVPVIVLNTHGHLDHVGADQLFDMSYISKEDEATMLSSTREGRLRGYSEFMAGNTAMIDFATRNMVGDKPFKYGFIKDGDQIDLGGGVVVEAIGFPGHTPGSMAYVVRKDKIAFTGDSVLFRVLLNDRQKLAQWADSVRSFEARTTDIDTIINGHQWEPFHRSDLDEELRLAAAIQNYSITGTRKFFLQSERTIYTLGTKRIGLTNDSDRAGAVPAVAQDQKQPGAPATPPTPAAAAAPPYPSASTPLGSGPYRAIMEPATNLPTHTVYRPADPATLGTAKLPIVAWANGACANSGNRFRWFLSEISSYGYFVVAIGPIGPVEAESFPEGSRVPQPAAIPTALPPVLAPPATHSGQLIDAIDWAVAENERSGSPVYHRLDTHKIAVMGQSCGGVQAIEASADKRVTTSMIWNSGLFPTATTMAGGKLLGKADLKLLHAPTAYISGDAQDVAFPNANDDFDKIKSIPVFRAYEQGVPHIATYRQPNGGEFGGVAVAWLNWQLKGDQRSALMFVGKDCGLCVNPRWVVRKKNMK
jgi:glyoxylase-like metal-dependent hydrolase (beta-lactamase superfamily II)